MPKRYSPQEVIKILEREGFKFVSQKGSHRKYDKTISGLTLTVIVPIGKKELPQGTFLSILRQAALSRQNFERLAK